MIPILIGIISILILIILILNSKIHDINVSYDTLQQEYNDLKNDFEFIEKENTRCQEQINIYEKIEEQISTVKIGNKKVKKNPIYKGKRALIGDYHEWSSENTMNILKSFGLIVDVVRTGEDIVDKIKHGYKCDIIFTNNIYRRGDDGPTTLNQLKKIKGFNIPVIIHTISENERHYFMDICGFDEYVVKPLDQEKIKPILDNFLGSR